MQRKGIIVAGSLIADVFYKIDAYPKEGCLSTVRDIQSHVGGSGNLIQDLARLDIQLPVRVSAIVGKDERGDMLMRQLGKYPNVDLSHVQREGNSSVTMVMNAQDTKQRTFFFLPEASDRYDMSCIDWDSLSGDIFHLEYLLLMEKVDEEDMEYGTHGARILCEAKRRGMRTSIDMVSEQSTRATHVVASALHYTDYCAINEVEAQAVTGVDLTGSERALEEGAERALRKLQELGVSKWAVIHSPKCGYGLDCETGRFVSVPSLKLPEGFIKGTNGAGDAFCSGVLYAAVRGDSIENALRLAAACAVCSLSEENGTDGMRSYEDVLRLAEQISRSC